MIASVALLLSLTLPAGLDPGSCPSIPRGVDGFGARHACPMVYQVWKGGNTVRPWNLLIVGDGFRKNELPDYRCAVRLLVEGLMASKPYADYACHINIFRMDVATSGMGGIKDGSCELDPGETCVDNTEFRSGMTRECHQTAWSRNGLASFFLGEPVVFPWVNFSDPPPLCITADFNARHCGTNPLHSYDCLYLWPTPGGRQLAHSLAQCITNPKAVLIVANSAAKSGGGTWGPNGTMPMALITLADLEYPDQRWWLMAHELAHTLGILDEYLSERGSEKYKPDQNLYYATDPGFPDAPPWVARCPETPPGALDQVGQSCPIVYNDAGDCPGVPDDYLNPTSGIGMWQGGFYTQCEYFRSEESCRMSGLGYPFCVGCRDAFDRFFLSTSKPPCRCRHAHSKPLAPLTPERYHLLLGHGAAALGTASSESPWLLDGVPASPVDLEEGTVLPELLLPMGRFRARVEIDGLVGELDVERLSVEFERPDGGTHELTLRRVRGAPYDRLEWRIGDRVLEAREAPGQPQLSPMTIVGGPDGGIRILGRQGGKALTTDRVEFHFWPVEEEREVETGPEPERKPPPGGEGTADPSS